LLSQDYPKLDSDVIASNIVSMVSEKSDVSIAQIIKRMRSLFGYTVSYKKAWSAKQKAVARAFGNWENSYALLPRWMTALQQYMPGTAVEFYNKECPESMRSDGNVALFHRVFWSFKSCIDAFDYLKPLIQIDGTFLYGKYRGTLLITTSQDGDRHVVPLAFAIDEGETTEAWT